MTRIAKLILVGGGMALGLVSAGIAAIIDKDRMKRKPYGYVPPDRPTRHIDLRRLTEEKKRLDSPQ